jgi:hypothetical protein
MGGHMQLNYENVMRDYSNEYGTQLSPECFQIFSVIAQYSYGNYNDDFLIDKDAVCQKVSMSTRSCVQALRDLAAMELIHLTQSKGGRGVKSYYAINLKTVQKLHCNVKQCKINSVKKGTIHGFEKPINISNRSVEESHEETPTALPSASPPAVKPARSYHHKKTQREHDAFNATYAIFEKRRGKFEPGLVNKEMPIIWKLISKAQTVSPDNWEDLLARMLAEFWRIKTSGREQDAFLAKQPFLPSALNSSGIWPRVLENLRSTESKKPTAEDVRLMDIAAAALRG